MRIVLHNPNNVKGARTNELSLAYENMDAVLMPGTQTKLKKHAKQAVQYTNDQHHIYEWGWTVEVTRTTTLDPGRVGALSKRCP